MMANIIFIRLLLSLFFSECVTIMKTVLNLYYVTLVLVHEKKYDNLITSSGIFIKFYFVKRTWFLIAFETRILLLKQ